MKDKAPAELEEWLNAEAKRIYWRKNWPYLACALVVLARLVWTQDNRTIFHGISMVCAIALIVFVFSKAQIATRACLAAEKYGGSLSALREAETRIRRTADCGIPELDIETANDLSSLRSERERILQALDIIDWTSD